MIIYPVPAVSRWATWSISQAEIIKHNKPWPRADGGEIVGLNPDLVPLLEVQEAQPIYDPATHYLTRSEPVVDVNANTHTHGWTIVARSQEDLDAEAEREIAKAHYAALKDGSATVDEVKNVLAWVLRQVAGNL